MVLQVGLRIVEEFGEALALEHAAAATAPIQLLRLKSVAARLEVCTRTVQRMIKRGELRVFVLNGSTPMVSATDLAAFVAARRVK